MIFGNNLIIFNNIFFNFIKLFDLKKNYPKNKEKAAFILNFLKKTIPNNKKKSILILTFFKKIKKIKQKLSKKL